MNPPEHIRDRELHIHARAAYDHDKVFAEGVLWKLTSCGLWMKTRDQMPSSMEGSAIAVKFRALAADDFYGGRIRGQSKIGQAITANEA